MDRLILPYMDGTSLAEQSPHFGAQQRPATGSAKSPRDYARAIQKRAWLVVLVALAVILPGTIFVIRLPNVYRAAARIEIRPQDHDPSLAVIFDSPAAAESESSASDTFVPHALAQLQTKRLAEFVLKELGPSPEFAGNETVEITSSIAWKKLHPNTHLYEVSLEGKDPDRTTSLLNKLLDQFRVTMSDRTLRKTEDTRSFVETALAGLRGELTQHDREMTSFLKANPIFTPDGHNILQDEVKDLKATIQAKEVRFDEILQRQRVLEMYPSFKQSTLPPQYEQRLALLRQEQIKYQRALETAKRTAKNFNTDPSARHFAAELKTILDEIERIHSMAEASTERGRPDTAGTILEFADEELRHYRTELKKQLGLVQESMPKYQEYLTRVRAREDLERRIARMDRQIEQFALLANSHEKPVEVFEPALEPNSPARPRRALWIAFIASGGIGLGLGLVCLIESLDHSIRGPDQLAAGLVLPVFGVIPRIRRSAANTRGGHLWTAGDPGTLEADAFRNLRVGLLGHTDSVHRFTSILVTSAKAGEGKSTTALNLAAACARAGERTLLLDCDLRRSSLGDVFDIEPGEPGLVDVLRGDLPWTSAVARSDSLPNLFFLPIGDPTGIPIEVLGTVEQRRLIEAAVTQFDRVILDGPAVLGLADCRMLGRLVDSVLLVVRAGSADLRPARWAKHALDQSRVPVAGVVFNDLSEEVKLWSNGGYRAGELERHASWEDHRALTGPHSSSQSEPQPEPDGAGMVA